MLISKSFIIGEADFSLKISLNILSGTHLTALLFSNADKTHLVNLVVHFFPSAQIIM
jgi:hypothetical protein